MLGKGDDDKIVDAIPPGIPTFILPTTHSRSEMTRRPMKTLFKERYLWIAPGL
jgi:hypothetical protein